MSAVIGHGPLTRRTLLGAMAAASLLPVLAACGGSRTSGPDGAQYDTATPDQLYQAARAEKTLLIYASTPVPILDRLKAMWKQQYPEVDFTYIRADQGESRNRFLAESQGGRSSADIISVDEVSELILGDGGLISRYRPQGLNLTPGAAKAASDAAGMPWRGIGIGFAVNTSMLPQPPVSWAELAAGTTPVVWPDPRAGGGAYDLFVRLHETFGPDLLEQMGQRVQLRSAVIAAHDALAGGEFPVLASAYHYLVRSAAAKGSPVTFVPPSDGVDIFYSREAVASKAAHPAAARLYINFIMSEAVQRFLADEQFFIPVSAAVQPTDALTKTLSAPDTTLLPQPPLERYRDTTMWNATMTSEFRL